MELRRIRIERDEPPRDGETTLYLLATLAPRAASALTLAEWRPGESGDWATGFEQVQMAMHGRLRQRGVARQFGRVEQAADPLGGQRHESLAMTKRPSASHARC